MTEISSIDSSEPVFDCDLNEEKFPIWKQDGDILFATTIIAAFGGFLAGTLYKKRRPLSIASLPQSPEALQVSSEVSFQEIEFPPYAKLRCTDIDKKTIQTIITTLADANVLVLAWKASHLQNLGSQIDGPNGVHPYKFLTSIFCYPQIKEKMRTIFKEAIPLRKMGVMDGIAKGMVREKKSLDFYLPDFAAEVGVSPEKLKPLILAAEWGQLVHLLLETDLKHAK